jgi:hypothetical protein
MTTEHENLSRIQELVYELVELEKDPERKKNLKADLASSTDWFGSLQSIREFCHDFEDEIKERLNWHYYIAEEYIDANPADPE